MHIVLVDRIIGGQCITKGKKRSVSNLLPHMTWEDRKTLRNVSVRVSFLEGKLNLEPLNMKISTHSTAFFCT
jgi:hypothetical protein